MSHVMVSYDGGGVLGIGPAAFLAQGEMNGLNLRADAHAGCSVGSLLAACAARGLTFGETYHLFQTRFRDAFARPSLGWRLDPRKPKYDGKGLEGLAKHVFGNTRMNQLRTPLFVVAMDYARGRPKVWDITDGTPVWEAVTASCSAPTFFPPRGGLVDGGLVANSPAMVGISGAINKLGWKAERIWMLSMGTNGDYWRNPRIGENTSKLQWAKILLSTATRGNEEMAEFQARTMLNSRHFRIEPILSRDYPLDGFTLMEEYAQIWKGLWASQGDALKAFLSVASGA